MLAVGYTPLPAGRDTPLEETNRLLADAHVPKLLVEVRPHAPLEVAGEELEPDHPQRMHVVPRVGPLATFLLGGGIQRRVAAPQAQAEQVAPAHTSARHFKRLAGREP